MTREEILSTYEIDEHLVIQSPGKFECEAAWTPYFWNCVLEGVSDALDYEDGEKIDIIDVDDADRAIWPEIEPGIVAAALTVSDTGFVSCALLTASGLDQIMSDYEQAYAACEQDEDEDEQS